ncbi:unnamed protein product [Pleuronectes platessa]|uniref:Uncharacterized protein n=1 Tax=Pleuronectes platessa TaxID=8262 RepID=A0A9N7TRN4_PLEPL|nr:unnamed protein product [Pleuronectes platessa]
MIFIAWEEQNSLSSALAPLTVLQRQHAPPEKISTKPEPLPWLSLREHMHGAGEQGRQEKEKEKRGERWGEPVKAKSSKERLSECGPATVDQSHGVSDAVEGHNTRALIQSTFDL